MVRKLAVLTALVLAAALPARAQTLEEVLDKHYKAQGGLDKIKSVQTVRMTGKTLLPGMEAPFVLERKRPAMTRMEITVQGQTGIQAFDGTTAWVFMPFAGHTEPQALTAEQSQEAREEADFDGPLVDWKGKGSQLELAGKESCDGKDCWKIKLTAKDGTVSNIFLDAATALVQKVTAVREIQGQKLEVETIMTDYRDVDGWKLPFSLESKVVGMGAGQTLSFDKIELNITLDDARFKMPPPKKPDAPAAPEKPAAPAAPGGSKG